MISMVTDFWKMKSFEEMSTEEWESLCDGCAKCCLHKLEDDETGEVYYTDIACRYLDHHSCQCQKYQQRQQLVPDCVKLSPDDISLFYWLPSTCAYRLLSEGEPLPEWHPLLSKDPESTHSAGISVRGRVVAENSIAEEDYQERVIRWVDGEVS